MTATCHECGADLQLDDKATHDGRTVEILVCECGEKGALVHEPNGETFQRGCVDVEGAEQIHVIGRATLRWLRDRLTGGDD